jgi:hypothetical protein
VPHVDSIFEFQRGPVKAHDMTSHENEDGAYVHAECGSNTFRFVSLHPSVLRTSFSEMKTHKFHLTLLHLKWTCQPFGDVTILQT